jgi:hypothetical protein
VDAPEVVKHEVDRDGCGVVLDLLENAVVKRVKRRIPILVERFARST